MYKVHTEVLEKCKKCLVDSNSIITSKINEYKVDLKEVEIDNTKALYKKALSKLNKLYDNNEKLIKLLEDNYGV